jgi:hypothetical protein
MSNEAVLCVQCGFDTRSGRKLALDRGDDEDAVDGGLSPGKKKKKKKRSGETPQAIAFLYGCAASLGFALVGSVMWWVAFYLTGFEFGIIAWVLGGMAGGGMAIAYGHEDMLSGLAAAAMAFLGIWAANAMILATVLADPGKFGVDLGADLDDQVVNEQVFDETADEEPFEEEMAEDGSADVADDTPAGAFPQDEFPAGAANAVLGIVVVVGSLVMCFGGIFPIIWLILALSTAYKVGSGGKWTD